MTKRPLLCGVAAFVIGEWIGIEWNETMGLGIGILMILLAGIGFCWNKTKDAAKPFLFWLIVFWGLGCLNSSRCHSPEKLQMLLEAEPDTSWELEGRVLELQETKPYRILLIETSRLEGKQIGSTIPYRIRIYDDTGNPDLEDGESKVVPKLGIGSRIQCAVKLQLPEAARNPGEFDTRSYYQAKGIDGLGFTDWVLCVEEGRGSVRQFLVRLRGRAVSIIDANFSEEHAGLMCAILLGASQELSPDIRSLYRRNGISHILAISALHLSIIGGSLYRILRRLGASYMTAGIPTLVLLIGYGILTGGSVSVVRAVFMFGISVFGDILGRTYDMLTAAGLACLCILIQRPLWLQEPGFLLSFGAILALGLLTPEVTNWFEKYPEHGWKRYLADSVLSGLMIQIVTGPIIVFFYFDYPLYSFFLNLFVIPLMTPLLLCGFLGLLLFPVSSVAGTALFLPCSWILHLFQWLCQSIERLPGACLPVGRPSAWQLLLYYGGLLAVGILLRKQRKTPALLCGLFMLLLLVWCKPSTLRITVLDVGQGDCSLLETPQGDRLLIDGGSSSRKSVGTYVIVPAMKYYGFHKLDYVFVSHMDEDHVNGIREMIAGYQNKEIQIGCLVIPEKASLEPEFQELTRQAKEAGIPVRVMNAGDKLVLGEVELDCLYPDTETIANSGLSDANNESMVLSVSYRGFDMLFTGDLETKGEERLLQQAEGLKNSYDILKVGHHGSSGSSSAGFLERIRPVVSWISCGQENPYGHPHPETIERLHAVESRIFITAEQGAIEIRTNGRKMEFYHYGAEEDGL